MAEAHGTEARVCEDIARRQAFGMSKYGISVESNPLLYRAWLQHAYEEALDLSIYLRRCMEEVDKQNIIEGAPRTNEEKRKAVELMLANPEWSQWSNAEVARQCGVSDTFVANIRNGE